MRLKILRSFCLRPGVEVTPGEVVDATRLEGLEAVFMRRAVYVDDLASEPSSDPAPAEPTAAQRRKWGRK